METGNNLKYIIYLTTNLVNNKIYIGLHKTYTPHEFDGYLGCGVKIGDKHTYIHCNTPFESAVNKYGVNNFKRETLFVFDTLEEAINKEIELVDEEFIKRKDTYNVALGGGVPPAVTKTVYQFTLDGEFIKEWNSITEAANQYKCNTMSIVGLFQIKHRVQVFYGEIKTILMCLNSKQEQIKIKFIYMI